MKNRKAFTLIEVLMVVAVLGILAGIAIPNSLKAQQRAKIAKAMSDMRTVTLGLESYYVDNATYPGSETHAALGGLAGVHDPPVFDGGQLTTPIAYLSTMPMDPFDNAGRMLRQRAYDTANDAHFCVGRYDYGTDGSHYILASNGPDNRPQPHLTIGTVPMLTTKGKYLVGGDDITVSEITEDLYFNDPASAYTRSPLYFSHEPGIFHVYDPTNGSDSGGGLFMCGP